MKSLLLSISLLSTSLALSQGWRHLDDGLDFGEFQTDQYSPAGDSIITILRIDPLHWELKLLSLTGTQEERGLTAKQWCEGYYLAAAINAGMFNADHRAHTGYMRCGGDINNTHVNHYKSVAAFSPKDSLAAPFWMFDLNGVTIPAIQESYLCVIQNLRLIDRHRKNRWSQQNSRWSEAALGEDAQGRILFIFCRSPYSMYDLNNLLLSLPIDLVCAQHLEGGPEAQFYLNYAGSELQLVGSYESGFLDEELNVSAWPIPNVLGIVKK